jgi:4-diphosphocytidyl-2-C-methyl-D-erythritol kinase
MPALAARAKLNPYLAVLAREEGGYHQIETLFLALELADDVTVEPGASGIAVDVTGADLGPVESNLVHRAAVAYYAALGRSPAVRIRLHKRIPAGAGLGGGSSDAAATLRLLDALHDGALGSASLQRVGASLGADVPFFLSGVPFAVAWGRGERLLALPPPPPAPVLLAVPRTAVETAAAYAALAAYRAATRPPPPPPLPAVAALSSWAGLERLAVNAFEDVVFSAVPAASELRDAVASSGARIARLTGSGSCVFGIFETDAARDAAADALREGHPGATLIRTRTAAA